MPLLPTTAESPQMGDSCPPSGSASFGVNVWTHPCWVNELMTFGDVEEDREQALSIMHRLAIIGIPKAEDLKHERRQMTNDEINKLDDINDHY